MSLACPQDGIRVVSETFELNTLGFLASEGGTCPSLEEMGNKWIWWSLPPKFIGFSIRTAPFWKHFRARPGSDYDSKFAQDGLRVDQPEWSEFASLEEPTEGTVDGCVFSWGNSERLDHRSTCFICQVFVDVVYEVLAGAEVLKILLLFWLVSFFPKVCIFKHAGNVCSWCRPLVLEGIG